MRHRWFCKAPVIANPVLPPLAKTRRLRSCQVVIFIEKENSISQHIIEKLNLCLDKITKKHYEFDCGTPVFGVLKLLDHA